MEHCVGYPVNPVNTQALTRERERQGSLRRGCDEQGRVKRVREVSRYPLLDWFLCLFVCLFVFFFFSGNGG